MASPEQLYSLHQFSNVLGFEQKTLLNKRASSRPADTSQVAWTEKERDSRGHVVFYFDRLLGYLLGIGEYQLAYDVSVRKEQVDKFGECFKGKVLFCPFSRPKCRGNECQQCVLRRGFFAKHHRLPRDGEAVE